MKLKTRTPLFALCLALLGTLGACSHDDVADEHIATGRPITLTPALSAQAWTEGSGTQTRADVARGITFAPGGTILILMAPNADSSDDEVQQNTFEIDANGKLKRKPYDPSIDDTEANLNVPGPGAYYFRVFGYVNCLLSTGIPDTPGIPMKAYIGNDIISCNIAADGTFTIDCILSSAAIELKLLTPDGNPYAAGDVTATLSTALIDLDNDPITTPTLVPATGLAAWGELGIQLIDLGDEVMRLTVGGTAYKVISPARISLLQGRLVTFSVRIGATGITVEMKDGSDVVTDFVVEAVTDVEAEIPIMYNGVPSKKLSMPGLEAYWIAPVNAVAAGTAVQDIDFATICPEGWHAPTIDELIAMAGSGENPALCAAFGPARGIHYLSSTNYKTLYVHPGGSYSPHYTIGPSTSGYELRCVKKAN